MAWKVRSGDCTRGIGLALRAIVPAYCARNSFNFFFLMKTSALLCTKFMGTFIVGILIGLGVFCLVYPRLAPTSPVISLGENTGRIVAFDISAWGTPNMLFQQEGRLPVVFYPSVENMTSPTVTLLDGGTMSYQEFVANFTASQGEDYAHALFTVSYKENDVDELGYVTSIKQVK